MMNHLTEHTLTVYHRLGPLRSQPFRLCLAFAWTILLTVLLTQSSGHPVVGPPAPPGAPNLLREIELTCGHIVGFFGLVMLWWWALSLSLAEPRALFVAVGFALIFGVMTEVAQSAVPDREVSLFDLAVNWSVTIIAAVFISSRWRKPSLPSV
jgi:VanZ family protein